MISVTADDFFSDKARVVELIEQHSDFEVNGLGGRMSEAVSRVESLIEGKGYSCRIYTRGRKAAVGASFFGGVTGMFGIASTIGIAAHNLFTYGPDFEVAKHRIDNKLTITYQK